MAYEVLEARSRLVGIVRKYESIFQTKIVYNFELKRYKLSAYLHKNIWYYINNFRSVRTFKISIEIYWSIFKCLCDSRILSYHEHLSETHHELWSISTQFLHLHWRLLDATGSLRQDFPSYFVFIFSLLLLLSFNFFADGSRKNSYSC